MLRRLQTNLNEKQNDRFEKAKNKLALGTNYAFVKVAVLRLIDDVENMDKPLAFTRKEALAYVKSKGF